VQALRSVGASVVDAHILGRGFPDLIVGCPEGSTYLIEVKMPGEGLNEKEFIFHRDWPGRIYISHSVEEAISDYEFENINW